MITLAAGPTVDPSAAAAPILLSLLASAAFYVWTALALSAVFRKAGEESWKAWVPFLNLAVVLQLGGLSGWLVLLMLVPILGSLALWVAVVIACYRVNVSFGYGGGMTVLAALLFPVWATIVGFGSARWLGGEEAAGARRSSIEQAGPAAGGSPADGGRTPSISQTSPSAGGWAPSAAPAAAEDGSLPPAPPVMPVPAPASAASTPAPPGAADAPDEPISFVPLTSAAAPAAPAPPVPPLPDDVLAEPSAPAPASAARANQGWGGFDLGAVAELTSEVTAAVAGAPSPVSAVPREAAGADAAPAVTRVPAARPTRNGEPWAPARSPFPEADAFPEASGEVSAVVGAPDAGIPRSARASVSAQHVRPEVPEGDDHPAAANRRNAHWSLVLPTGSPVELTADVVIVGRRPAPSTAYPGAQLIEVHDGTVSKTHLRLERDGENWSVIDLHSTNGTVLVAPDGAEREIVPGAPHRAAPRLLLGDAELWLSPADASR